MKQTTVFQHVHIFDGARMLPADTVVVRESTIMAVGSDLAIPADAIIIDGTGQTLLPGLIDAHTHTFGTTLQQASCLWQARSGSRSRWISRNFATR